MERDRDKLSNVGINSRMKQLVVFMIIVILGVLISHLFQKRDTIGKEIKTSVRK